jgi:cytochrome c6
MLLIIERRISMKKIASLALIVAACCMPAAVLAADAPAKEGAALFKQYCAVCHPDGNNIVNQKKTLHKKDREANGIKSEKDIIRVMRNPGSGMQAFDEKTVSNSDAKEIAEYVIKTFSK